MAETSLDTSELEGVRLVKTGVAIDVAQIMDSAGLQTTTMGRTVAEDLMFFECAVSAGVLAGQMLASDVRKTLGNS
jgi:hypothetical protein